MCRHERRATEQLLAGIGATDLIIAATAERLGLPLATHNVRHFPMVEGLEPAYRR
jgi:predicted nucleic acid-binding protein